MSTPSYRREIDGLRALAVLPVALFHAGVPGFSGGFIGVDVFFVISGFLITGILLRETRDGTFSFSSFYERRARRILPGLAVVVAACVPASWLWLSAPDFEDFSRSVAAVGLFAANVNFWRASGYFDPAGELKPLLHTWSLAVEEQFYVIFPFVMLALARRKRLVTTIAIAAGLAAGLSLGQWATMRSPNAAFFLLPTRAWELLMGALGAVIIEDRLGPSLSRASKEALSGAGIAAVLVAVVTFSKSTPTPGLWGLVPAGGTLLILLYATGKSAVGRILSMKLPVTIGLWSYSIYLWHQPLLAFLRHRDLYEPALTLRLAAVGAAVALGGLSHALIERPFRDRKFISRRAIFVGSVCVSGAMAVVGLVGYYNKGLPGREPESLQVANRVTMKLFEQAVQACWSRIDDRADFTSGCEVGTQAESPSFALLGDSHAGALLSSLDAEARRAGLAGVGFSYRSCIPLPGLALAPSAKGSKNCQALLRSLYLNPEKLPDVVILVARWTLFVEQTRFDNEEGGIERGPPVQWINDRPRETPPIDQLRIAVRSLLDAGKRVVLVYPIPEAGWDVPVLLSKAGRLGRAITPEFGSTSYSRFLERNAEAIRLLDSIGNDPRVLRVRPHHRFCNNEVSGRCVTHHQGTPLYYDNNHLTPEGASTLAVDIIGAIAPQQPNK